MDADPLQFVCSGFSYEKEIADVQWPQNIFVVFLCNNCSSIGFLVVAAHFCKNFIKRCPCRKSKSQFFFDLMADLIGDLLTIAE